MSVSDLTQRLDVCLVNLSLAPSREAAKKLIVGGVVFVNDVSVCKPSFPISASDTITVKENDINKYVSRGAFKLEGALDSFDISAKGLVCVDIGASTGGFTDVLLQRGAIHVYAIENGSGQLHPKLASDSRVTSFENVNARYIPEGFIPRCDIAVMDVSFISQTKLFQGVSNVLKKNGIFVSLIKPQFEAGRSKVGKNGIVKDSAVHKKVIEDVCESAMLHGFKKVSVIPSPILGGDGNKEYLAYFINEGTTK